MERVWITNGSTSVAPMVNALNAACHDGYLPTDIYILENPGVADVVGDAASMMKTIVTASGGAEPTVEIEHLADELDFDGMASYVTAAIEGAHDADADIAVDVTPGRRFWAIISFQAGNRYDVDHLFYGHTLSSEYYGTAFPNIPRTALNLIDFTEVVG